MKARKTIGILLLTALVLPFSLSYMHLQTQKKAVKKAIKRRIIRGLDREDLVLLKFTSNETGTLLRWIHSREFEYQGEMYDVVTAEVREDSAFYWCWWDYEETSLNRQLSRLVAKALGSSPVQREHQQRVQHLLRSLYPPAAPTLCFEALELSPWMFCFFPSFIGPGWCSLPDPPPKMI